MFNKTNVKKYLLTVFSVIIGLSIFLATVSITGLLITKSNMDKLIYEILEAESAVKTCTIEANIAARDLREMAIADTIDNYDEFKSQINKSIDAINENILIFKNTYGEKDGLANKYENAFEGWFNIAESVIKQLEQENKEKAKELIQEECSPALKNLSGIVDEIRLKTEEKVKSHEKYGELIMKIFISVSILTLLFVLIVSIYIQIRTTKNITGAIDEIKVAMTELSKGNLQTRVEYESQNEFGELAELMNFSFEELYKYVKAIDYEMSEFSKGNFDIECPISFLGDFENIEKSIDGFNSKINDIFLELGRVSSQVSFEATQVSGASESLAKGAIEQSSSIQQLLATITEIASQISQNAEYTQDANRQGEQVEGIIQNSKEEMKQMLQAMNDISLASENIKKIINTIYDIADQTNILALNATIEAARAGDSGKGFAVVAAEVRKLANKSAEAAKDTNELIENSLGHVSYGEKLAISTNSAFQEVTNAVKDMVDMLEKIAYASEEQSSAVTEISYGMDQISLVVDMNSAASQESAALSEELDEQARIMKGLLDQFKIRG